MNDHYLLDLPTLGALAECYSENADLAHTPDETMQWCLTDLGITPAALDQALIDIAVWTRDTGFHPETAAGRIARDLLIHRLTATPQEADGR